MPRKKKKRKNNDILKRLRRYIIKKYGEIK